MSNWLLGVDAGGSTTRAVLWETRSGEVLAAESGPGNPWSAGAEEAAQAIEEAIASVCALGGMHLREVGGAALGIAGNGRWGLPEAFWARTAMWGMPKACRWLSDLEIATVAGLKGGSGVHVVVGTGSSLMVQDRTGRRRQVGGWGWFLGDEGSAFDLGKRLLALRLLQLEEGGEEIPGEASRWAQAGVASSRELMGFLADPARWRPRIAGMGKVVLEGAESGDLALLEIVSESLGGLMGLVTRALGRVAGPEAVPISLSGGVARSGLFRREFSKQLETRALSGYLTGFVPSPVVGALIEAGLASGESLRFLVGNIDEIVRRGA